MTPVPTHPQRLVVLEGIDGTGKSTLAKLLLERLQALGLEAEGTAEPSASPLGKMARAEAARNPLGAALLFTLDRADRRPRLRRLLQSHDLIVSDRSYFSTLAYQGSFLSPTMRESLREMERELAVNPDLVLWIDGPVELALQRLGKRVGGPDHIERLEFLKAVRKAYTQLAYEERKRFVRLDLRLTPPKMADEALAAILHRWPELKKSVPRTRSP